MNALLLLLSTLAFGADKLPYRESKAAGNFMRPAEAKPKNALAKLKVPEGFKVNVFAEGLGGPRMMVVTEDGRVLVSRPKEGDVLSLRDSDGDGASDERKTIVSGLKRPHGMGLHEGKLFLVAMKTVYTLNPKEGAKPSVLIDGLPDVGQHENRSIAISPQGELFVSIASTCNNCDDPTPKNASMLRFSLDGKNEKLFAQGLRDTIGFDWRPGTAELWGMDHGKDWNGDDMPMEELNLLQEGKHYGWPYCMAKKIPDDNLVDEPEGESKKEFCARSEAPVIGTTAHSAPIAMKFYSGGQFPEAYRGDAFVALHGSWNRKPPSGYKVARIRFENGKPTRFEDFLTGFLAASGKEQYGRPAGLAIDRDGSLLVSDDSAGVIYRVSYGK